MVGAPDDDIVNDPGGIINLLEPSVNKRVRRPHRRVISKEINLYAPHARQFLEFVNGMGWMCRWYGSEQVV